MQLTISTTRLRVEIVNIMTFPITISSVTRNKFSLLPRAVRIIGKLVFQAVAAERYPSHHTALLSD